MFSVVKSCGPDGDYQDLVIALKELPDGEALVLKKGGVYSFTEPLTFRRTIVLQPETEESITITAPLIKFDAPPKIFMVMNLINFVGKVEVTGGSTVTFDRCSFTCPSESNAIITVTDSSPNIRMCHFHDFPGYGLEYLNSKGGILTDCVFEKIGKDSFVKIGAAKPYHSNNKVQQ